MDLLPPATKVTACPKGKALLVGEDRHHRCARADQVPEDQGLSGCFFNEQVDAIWSTASNATTVDPRIGKERPRPSRPRGPVVRLIDFCAKRRFPLIGQHR
jgi:hypothetical protein